MSRLTQYDDFNTPGDKLYVSKVPARGRVFIEVENGPFGSTKSVMLARQDVLKLGRQLIEMWQEMLPAPEPDCLTCRQKSMTGWDCLETGDECPSCKGRIP